MGMACKACHGKRPAALPYRTCDECREADRLYRKVESSINDEVMRLRREVAAEVLRDVAMRLLSISG